MTQERRAVPPEDTSHRKEALVRALSRPRFEVIPIRGAAEQAAHLPSGARVAVTCSPALGMEATLDFSEELAEREDLRVVPHVSARLVESEDHLREILTRLDGRGLREVFVIGGDAKVAAGPYESAGKLLSAMSEMEHSVESVGIPAYPETHPLVSDEGLVRALASKQPFASYMVTQICFDADTIVGWLRTVRERGITLPVYVGLPGVIDRRKLLNISTRIGIGDSLRFLKKQSGLLRLVKPGGYTPENLIEDLAPYLGDPFYSIAGFHLNTFNQVESTEKWRKDLTQRLSDRAGASQPRRNLLRNLPGWRS